MKVVLISCVKGKLSHSAVAAELYTSTLFTGSLKYARRLNADRIYILSAKYGLLELDQVVEPYEETLKGKPVSVVRSWAYRVITELGRRTDLQSDRFVLLAGENYRKHLLKYIHSFEIPLQGKNFGQQLSFYASINR